MRRVLTVSLCAGLFLFVPAVAQAQQTPTPQHVSQYKKDYAAARAQFGPSQVGCNYEGKVGSCHVHPTDSQLVQSDGVLQRLLAPPAPPTPALANPSTPAAAPAAPADNTAADSSGAAQDTGGGDYSDVPGVPADFAACVARAESTDGTDPNANGNIYGITPGSGSDAGSADLATQKAAFAQMYAAQGDAPWRPYDGCSSS